MVPTGDPACRPPPTKNTPAGVLPGFFDYYISARMQAKKQRAADKVRAGGGRRQGVRARALAGRGGARRAGRLARRGWRGWARAVAPSFCERPGTAQSSRSSLVPAPTPPPFPLCPPPPPPPQSDLALGKKLGSGAFGSVYRATLAPEAPGGEPTAVVVKNVSGGGGTGPGRACGLRGLRRERGRRALRGGARSLLLGAAARPLALRPPRS